MRGWVTRAARGRAAVTDTAPQVLAMDGGSAPWVATPYEPDRAGAERFLESVLVRGTLIGERHGPDFEPHWADDRSPALPAPPRDAPPPVETRRSVVVAGVVLTVLLVLLAVMVPSASSCRRWGTIGRVRANCGAPRTSAGACSKTRTWRNRSARRSRRVRPIRQR